MSFLDTLFRTIAQGIIVLDPQGMILRTNPAAKDILGMEVEDALMRGEGGKLGSRTTGPRDSGF